jgi:hypothetical protein
MVHYIAFNFLVFQMPNFGSEILKVSNMTSFGLEHQKHKNLIQQYKVKHTKN